MFTLQSEKGIGKLSTGSSAGARIALEHSVSGPEITRVSTLNSG